QLVYYPENYIDPTVRTGQTSMMDTMLNTIGQSELSADTVGDAFKGYMTQFEKVANLDIVSAYHDNLSIEEGKTWFIGRSTVEGEKYYWRSLQQGMLTDGKYPATAWSEWLEIGTGIAAYNNMVRPVVFNDRLYVVWVTQLTVATDNSGTVSESKDYFLNFSYLRHDGSWSAPLFGKLSAYLSSDEISAIATKRLFCANNNEAKPEIIALFYTAAEAAADNKDQEVPGISISIEHEFAAVADAGYYHGFSWPQYDTQSELRVNFLFSPGTISWSSEKMSYGWGYEHLSIMIDGNCSVNSAKLNTDTQSVDVTINANVCYQFNGWNHGRFGNNRRALMDMIKTMQSIGLKSYFFKDPITVKNSDPNTPECVVAYTDKDDDAVNAAPRGYVGSNKYIRQQPQIEFDDHNNPLLMASERGRTLFIFGLRNEDMRLSYEVSAAGLSFSQFGSGSTEFTTNVSPSNVKVKFSCGGTTEEYNGSAIEYVPLENKPQPGWYTTYPFRNMPFTIPGSAFVYGRAEVDVLFTASSQESLLTTKYSLGQQNGTLTIYQKADTVSRIMPIIRTDAAAQYLQRGPYRVRVNTLFARQLVARANLGLDAVLSMETQLLQEPKLGKGFYCDFVIPPYDASVHGNSRVFYLYLMFVSDVTGKYPIYSGTFTDTAMTVRVFVPADETPLNGDIIAQVFMVDANHPVATANTGWRGAHFIYDGDAIGLKSNSVLTMFQGVNILGNDTEPMDFAGANALYFWEMFFYVPAMVFQRLLQESKFDEATTWMKYIWNPAGYYSSNGTPAPWTWNVRPLEEDTSWNPDPLDSVDPDAVAQSDPMHYKIAIFMRALDLLTARGDAAYRLLERDTLNEAKMWYEQALNLLGDEPYDALVQGQGSWSSPVLGAAASQTLQQSYQTELLNIRTETVAEV
ncbi:neuraminidase-like domain-containing protein, partial [Kosakonia quasisacchari]|uniref:neuraminidase-like domain-containing protein n=1 Tax=Kosakonia quasisacchari TaxID=2529380 RepID=UPI0039DF7A8D